MGTIGDHFPHLHDDPRYRHLLDLPVDAIAGPPRPRAPEPASLLPLVSACPDRGGVLPLSMQLDCNCRGAELSECRAGKGRLPGRVTLRECLACKSAG